MLLVSAIVSAQDTTRTNQVTWQEVAVGVFRTESAPHAHALIHEGRCLIIGAPYRVTPATLPPAARSCDLVLLTHHHRDVTATTADFVARGIPVRAPKLTEAYLSPEGVQAYWKKSMPVVTPGRWPPLTERFWNDWTYLVHPTGVNGVVFDLADGVAFDWHGWKMECVATPGHSKDHMSFVATNTSSEQAICFSGDAIAGAGRIWSPYTLEWHHQKDEGAVAAALSLRRLASLKPTLVLPEHGAPLSGRDIPAALIETAELLSQMGAAKNYDAFTTSLGAPPDYKFLAPEQVGTANPMGNPVPWSKVSDHLYLSGNTYALASTAGPVLLMDPYSQNIVERVNDLKRDHRVGPVEVAMISHAHNDHYTGIFALPDRDSFQVWTLANIAQVVDHPHRYLAPYVDAREPRVDRLLKDGETVRWRDYELKVHHLPGQTTFGMGIEVAVDGKRCLFTGDNFYHHSQYSGSGGWSGRNRGLPTGYSFSAAKILDMRPDWILAEHGGAFEFNEDDFRRRRDFAVRAGQLADRLSVHGDHRFDWDPQRIRVEPLISTATNEPTVKVKLAISNPLKDSVEYAIQSGRGDVYIDPVSILVKGESTAERDLEIPIPPGKVAGWLIVPIRVEDKSGVDCSDTFAVIAVGTQR
jgi:glyoxylase-like metal-dependent hydrolase (beta-lactamase superfamily II)